MFLWIKKKIKHNRECLTFNKVIKPLIILLFVSGLFPCAIESRNGKRFTIKPKTVFFNTTFAFTYISVICLFLYWHLQYLLSFHEETSLTEGVMTEINYITELFSLILMCIVTYICVFNYRFKCVTILNTLACRIDAPNFNSVKTLARLRFQIFISIGYLVLALAMQICVNFTRDDSFWKMILVFFTFNLPQMIQFTAIALFYILIAMVVALMRNIRRQMQILAREKKIYMDSMPKTECLNRVQSLRQMEAIYVEASELKEDVNRVFEAPILMTLMQCFHAIVSESHIIYHGVVVQNNMELHGIVNCSVWVVYQLLKIYVVACAGDEFKIQALKLCRAVNCIPTERQDLRFMMEVQHCSSTMASYGKELTIYGFFPLDATLTFKMIASAAMYIIILVQFDKRC